MPEVDGSGERLGGVATVNFRLFVAVTKVFSKSVLNIVILMFLSCVIHARYTLRVNNTLPLKSGKV